MSENLHLHHRSRLKKRFINAGTLDGFEEHNVLELLLFFGIPQGDVNELAHQLLDKFGSLGNLMDADFSVLCEQKGIGEHTATLLKLIPQLSNRYHMSKRPKQVVYNDAEKIGEFFIDFYRGINKEVVSMMLLDNRLELIDCVKVFYGSVNSSDVNPRVLAEIGLRHNAACFILAHNHPNGNTIPSAEDLSTTRALREFFAMMKMPMAEHYLVAEDDYLPLLRPAYKDKYLK